MERRKRRGIKMTKCPKGYKLQIQLSDPPIPICVKTIRIRKDDGSVELREERAEPIEGGIIV
jgi:hypothetical protein